MNDESRYAMVVDKDGFVLPNGNGKNFVIVTTVTFPVLDTDGKPVKDADNKMMYESKEIPLDYTLRKGERLIYEDWLLANSMIKPRWNGQSWDETATPEEIEATLPPLETILASKIAELGAACEAAIYAGVSVQTQKGNEHFSLTINDQTNIANLAAQAQAGITVLYHADGQLCRPFAPDDMLAVAAKAIEHKTRHTTLCNHYNMWARRVQTRAELMAITYGCPLPDDLAGSMKVLMGWGDGDE